MTNKNPQNMQLSQSQRWLESSSDHPVIPFGLISSQMINRLPALSIPPLHPLIHYTAQEKAVKYMQEYIHEFFQNRRLNNQLAEVLQYRNYFANKYNSLKAKKTTDDAIHRRRRFAKDIKRLFICPMERCKKGYGSEGSLSHHIRLKHIEFYQSGQYQQFIQRYIDHLNDTKKKGELVVPSGEFHQRRTLRIDQKIEVQKGEGLGEEKAQ